MWGGPLLAIALAGCGNLSWRSGDLLPDGRLVQSVGETGATNRLAYIDASHLESYSDLNWGFDAINGLALTLMRNGYLTLSLPEIRRERLERASLVVLIAPSRPFSREECACFAEFVRQGGSVICTAGAEDAAASRSLLAQLGLEVPQSPVPTGGGWHEPEPFGRFRSLYLDANDYGAGNYRAGVLFHAGWPVELKSRRGEVLVRGKADRPIVARSLSDVGPGTVVLIGDSGFALNKNLEYITGEPFEDRYENAHFWRWLLSRITGRTEWVPPLDAAGHPPGDDAGKEASP